MQKLRRSGPGASDGQSYRCGARGYRTRARCINVQASMGGTSEEGDAPRIYGDWREFRAKLVASTGQFSMKQQLLLLWHLRTAGHA